MPVDNLRSFGQAERNPRVLQGRCKQPLLKLPTDTGKLPLGPGQPVEVVAPALVLADNEADGRVGNHQLAAHLLAGHQDVVQARERAVPGVDDPHPVLLGQVPPGPLGKVRWRRRRLFPPVAGLEQRLLQQLGRAKLPTPHVASFESRECRDHINYKDTSMINETKSSQRRLPLTVLDLEIQRRKSNYFTGPNLEKLSIKSPIERMQRAVELYRKDFEVRTAPDSLLATVSAASMR